MAVWLHSVSSVSASLFDTEPVYSCPVFSCFIFTFICCFSCPWHLSQCLGIVSGKWHRCTSVWNPTLLSWSWWAGTELPLTWKDGLTPKAELSSLHLLQIKRCLLGRRDSSQKWPRILFLCNNIHFFADFTLLPQPHTNCHTGATVVCAWQLRGKGETKDCGERGSLSPEHV